MRLDNYLYNFIRFTIVCVLFLSNSLSYSRNRKINTISENEINITRHIVYSIKGVVKDSKGTPLAGVSIIVKGTSKGTQTDFQGKYLISANNGQVLVFKYLGFKTKEVVVNNQREINVVMKEDVDQLKATVVTGYRKIKSNEFAGSAVTLKSEKVRIGGVSSIDKMLQGQVAGVQVTTSSSTFGAAPKIRIRGSSSISGINSPLWVLDGVVMQRPVNINPSQLYSGTARNLLSSVLGGVNPDDIDTITVLKDATATALYGTRAVNGVIVITTKRGRKSQPLKLSYNSLFTYNVKPSVEKFNVADSKVEVDIHEQLYDVFQSELLNYSANNQGAFTKLLLQRNRKDITQEEYLRRLRNIKSVNTDWFDHLFKNNVTQQHSISAVFGGDKSAGRASVSFYTDPGFSIGQNVKRYTLNLSDKFDFTKKFSAEVLIKYSDRLQKNPGTGDNPYNYASKASRAMRPYDDDGNLEYYVKDYAKFNIINEINNDYIDIKAKNMNAQIQLDYKPLDRLKFKLLANRTTVLSSIRSSQTENSDYAQSFRTENFNFIRNNERLYQDPDKPANALPESILPYGGVLRENNIETITNTFRFQGDYTLLDNDFNNLNVFGGTEIINNRSNETQFTGYGYIFNSGTSFPSELALKKSVREPGNYYGTSVFRKNQVSFYGSLLYNMLHKYNLTMSFRNDATNISGTSSRNRFLPTYTVAGAWLVHEEDFMQNQDIISNLKLRASYGLRGNAGNRGPDVVANYRNISRIFPKYNVLAVSLDQPEISDLQFEKEYIINLGVDLSFLKYFNLTVNYYDRKNFDLIGPKSVPLSVGYDTKTINWAIMTNQGYEVSFRTNPFKIPLRTNANHEDRMVNRRVEIKLE